MENIAIYWFRKDLRLSDNQALSSALTKHDKVIAIYVFDDKREPIGSASKCWLHHSLKNLDRSLNSKLSFYCGDSKTTIFKLLKQYGARAVYWNRCYEPKSIDYDQDLKNELKLKGVDCYTFGSSLLKEPWEVSKDDGTQYKVYTPFYKKLASLPIRHPIDKPDRLDAIFKSEDCLKINDLNLLPEIDWHISMMQHWQVGEQAAEDKLNVFLNDKIDGYKEFRNFPNLYQVSKLSPHIHFGEISANQIWYKVKSYEVNNGATKDSEHFLMELVWREFSYYLLYHFPQVVNKNFLDKFDAFPWSDNKEHLLKWQRGETGVPIVDAAMRELWQTGFMHNRCRMIVASYLTKNLLIDWRHGRDWFDDCLVDADLANNVLSWQWVAGCGADAAPYFRIFNPILQGEKFDFDGKYTKNYLPELRNIPQEYLFKPWEAPQQLLVKAGVKLGENYPLPIVDLKETKDRAMESYKSIAK